MSNAWCVHYSCSYYDNKYGWGCFTIIDSVIKIVPYRPASIVVACRISQETVKASVRYCTGQMPDVTGIFGQIPSNTIKFFKFLSINFFKFFEIQNGTSLIQWYINPVCLAPIKTRYDDRYDIYNFDRNLK